MVRFAPFLFCLFSGFQLFTTAAIAADLPVATEFPEQFPTIEQLQIVTLGGEEVSGEDLLGKSVAVVFLKPTCSKCTVKLPGVDKTFQTFKDEGFQVIAVSSAGDKESLSPTQQRYGYDWIWAGNSGQIKKQLDNHSPFEILIFDMAGVARFRIGENDSNWKVHLELCIGAAIERPLDLSAFPQGYVGSAVCGICHTEEWEQWLGTAHASSMSTLRKQQNHYKLDCVVCHVTGEAGKETRPWRMTPRELQEVGCEECHGPGGPHRTTPFEGADLHTTEESSCIRCHDEKNSPEWDYETYLTKVIHQPNEISKEKPQESASEETASEETASEETAEDVSASSDETDAKVDSKE